MAKMAKRGIESIAAAALVALFGVTPVATALELTGGPEATPPGGGGCTVSGSLGVGSGVTLTCTVSSPGSFTDLYFGLANNGAANGAEMDGSGPSGFEIFRYSGSTSQSIIYTSTTSIENIGTSEDVNTRLVLTLISGTADVIDTGGTPANNGNGDIEKLFRITGDAFSVHVDVQANNSAIPAFGAANSKVYDPTHTAANARSTTRVDVGFYYNACSP